MTKVCGKCKEGLPYESFHKASREKGGYQSWCKLCRKGHDTEGRKEYHKARYHGNKDQYLDQTYKRRYGISLAEYKQMQEDQLSVCKICGKDCSTGRALAVDHNHRTGKVRGLLCSNCNKGIGCLMDDPELLMRAINYLEKNND